METIRSRYDIEKIEDYDIKIRAILGAIKNCARYFGCTTEIYCTTTIIKKETDITPIKKFIEQHNLSISDFATLSYSVIRNDVVFYKKSSCFFQKLKELLNPYLENTKYYNPNSYNPYSMLGEKELEQLIIKNCDLENSKLKEFLKKYKLTSIDFITIVKTYYNKKLYYACGKDFNLIDELFEILNENHISKDEIRRKYQSQIEKEEKEKNLTKNNKKGIFNIFKKN